MPHHQSAGRPPLQAKCEASLPIPRPFESAGRGGDREADLDARLERADRLGHHFGRLASPAPPIQAKDAGNAGRSMRDPGHPGAGRPLGGEVRGKMEGALGQDFSDVRVHEGSQASSLGAVAYTRGRDIHFAPGKYSPKSHEGQKLLGHELAHVVQQRAGRVAVPQGKGAPINADSRLEKEADDLGKKAVSSNVGGSRADPPAAAGQSGAKAGAPASIQRKKKKQSYADAIADVFKNGNPNRGTPAPTGRYKNTTGHHDPTLAKWRKKSVKQGYTGKRGKRT